MEPVENVPEVDHRQPRLIFLNDVRPMIPMDRIRVIPWISSWNEPCKAGGEK